MLKIGVAASLALSCALTQAASAQPLTSLYSEISRTRCPADTAARTVEPNGVSYACPGRGGMIVDVAWRGAAAKISIRRAGEKASKTLLSATSGLEPRIEWRGLSGARGFAPQVAIVRLNAMSPKAGGLLAVVRIEDAVTCVAAYVDATANTGAENLARAAADEVAETFHCAVDAPKTVGVATPRTAAAVADASREDQALAQ